jgi:hypothetical protein
VCAEHWSAEIRMRRKDIAYRKPPRKFNEGFMFKTPKALVYQLTKVVTDGGMTGEPEQVAEGTAMMFAAVAKTTDNPMRIETKTTLELTPAIRWRLEMSSATSSHRS